MKFEFEEPVVIRRQLVKVIREEHEEWPLMRSGSSSAGHGFQPAELWAVVECDEGASEAWPAFIQFRAFKPFRHEMFDSWDQLLDSRGEKALEILEAAVQQVAPWGR